MRVTVRSLREVSPVDIHKNEQQLQHLCVRVRVCVCAREYVRACVRGVRACA